MRKNVTMKKPPMKKPPMKKKEPVKVEPTPSISTYKIFVRRSRDSKWKYADLTVTASSKILAAHIAAHRNPNNWVKAVA